MTQLGRNSERHEVTVPGRDERIVLSWASVSNVGLRRAANEDSLIAEPPIFAVADGMGGHAAGDLASAAVVARLSEIAGEPYLELHELVEALESATTDIGGIADEGELGVGTTVTGAALVLQSGNPYFAVFNIGDSRVYRYGEGELAQVTVDHSIVQELVDSGVLHPDDAEFHPDSNVITRAVGFNVRPQPDNWLLPIEKGMRLLVCSDGLTKEVDRQRLSLHLGAGLAAKETAHALVDAALASGGRDNISVIVLDVLDAPAGNELDTTSPRSGVSRS
ncbi:protein phosphatase [Diaminobutyricimonas aerilata]|uniref:Protein phosphatase n=1 Tax=Diaminobutyricimonas aerilata TaxID=1162967 RepID=A0A2M9CLG8_9MICO|nr:protein phosphatase 2C domain-containing protein [Diaminobutyricimonas aerilata]PJJ72710.1 protein phosphatase [Diaminobutyricimonas aerilata]